MSEDPTKRIRAYLTLAEAAATLPRRRRGRKVHSSTLWRWSRYGLNGVYLQVWAVGGAGLCTTLEALEQFFDSLSAAKGLRRQSQAVRVEEVAVDDRLAEHGLIDRKRELDRPRRL